VAIEASSAAGWILPDRSTTRDVIVLPGRGRPVEVPKTPGELSGITVEHHLFPRLIVNLDLDVVALII
jgi:hypothetical protein